MVYKPLTTKKHVRLVKIYVKKRITINSVIHEYVMGSRYTCIKTWGRNGLSMPSFRRAKSLDRVA